MNPSQLKGLGFAGLALAAILFFVAWERYDQNVSNVAAMNSFGGSAMFGGGQMEPAMPSATKYSLLFGALSAVGGVVCLMNASKSKS